MAYSNGEKAFMGYQMNLRENGHSFCNTCHKVLPLKEFTVTTKANGRPRVEAHCKSCTNKNRRAKRQA